MVPQPRGIAFAISSAILAVSLIAAADTPARADSSKRWPTLDGNAPLVIAHRGASGYFPEETLEAYRLAIAMGVDVVEPDIVVSKDGALIARIVANGLNRRDAPIFVQSFEPTSLQYMRSIGSRVRQVQLIDAFDVDFRNGGLIFGHEPDHLEFSQPTDWKLQGRTDLFDVMLTPAGLAEIATYADGIGPWKPMVVPVKCKLDNAGNCRDLDGNGTFDGYPDAIQQQPTTLVRDAHRASSRHRRAIEGPARRGGVPGTFRRVRRRWQALSVGLSRRERGAPTQRRDLHPHRIDPREREMAIARERIADRPAVRAGRESFRRRAVTRGKGQQARMKWAPGGALVLHRCNYV